MCSPHFSALPACLPAPAACPQGGQLVLSVRGGGGSPTTHYALTSSSLQSNGLEALLERNRTAEQLLDTATGS